MKNSTEKDARMRRGDGAQDMEGADLAFPLGSEHSASLARVRNSPGQMKPLGTPWSLRRPGPLDPDAQIC